MFKKIRLSVLLALSITGSTLVLACFLIYLWTAHEYRQVNAGTRVIHRVFMDNTKQRLQERVKTAIDDIHFLKDKAQNLLRVQLANASRVAADLLADCPSEKLGLLKTGKFLVSPI